MKILTGRLRGRTISYKPKTFLRPTADKARKAIFDMLQGQFEGKKALDLFSGTGALGFEAFSQGAEHVTFVEIDRPQARAVQEDLKKLGFQEKAEIVIADAITAIQRFSREERKFDFVLLDPPYEQGLGERTLTELAKSKVLEKDALVIYECRESKDSPEIDGFECIKDKVYGDTRILIYRCA